MMLFAVLLLFVVPVVLIAVGASWLWLGSLCWKIIRG